MIGQAPIAVKIGRENLSPEWTEFLTEVSRGTRTLQESGATADRPTEGLWVGRFFYDTTLGKPIWVHQVTPTIVWHDGAGAAV